MTYATVTETPGHRVTHDAITMMYTRYAFGARYCEGRQVLEVGCGAGSGLGYLGTRARRVVAGDYTCELFAGFPVAVGSARDHVVSALKRSAVRLGLVPKTMKGKEFLKRVFLGRLVPVPPELTNGAGKFETPVPVGGAASVRDFKVLYAVGRVV